MILQVQTKGHNDIVNITQQIIKIVKQSKIQDGIVVIFLVGSTAAITTIEYEEGIIQDLKNVLERIAPEDFDYLHHQKWGDRNGAAHIKSALIGTDFIIPIKNNELQLGAWQQVVLIDFDERARNRKIIVKVIKE